MVRSKYLALLLLLPMVACATRPPSPRVLYRAARKDMAKKEHTAGFTEDVKERMQVRYDKAVALYESSLLTTSDDLLFAAALLATSDRTPDLELAEVLGNESAAMGEKRALPVVAEIVDKLLLKRGMAQRYGTQYAYQPGLGRWRLYSVDPSTTDEDRALMGLPSLKTLQERVEPLNDSHLTKLLVNRTTE
ncbi:MAG: hypothetical protein ACI8QC_001592 [Planctomycetota bacterium]|jgi:hypothetical protein